jgi:hypothetical protein
MALNAGLPLPEDAVLLLELNHRINNEYASAISVVSRAAARSSSNEVKHALTSVTECSIATPTASGARTKFDDRRRSVSSSTVFH